MEVDGSVQYDDGFLPNMILFTQCYYHRGPTVRTVLFSNSSAIRYTPKIQPLVLKAHVKLVLPTPPHYLIPDIDGAPPPPSRPPSPPLPHQVQIELSASCTMSHHIP